MKRIFSIVLSLACTLTPTLSVIPILSNCSQKPSAAEKDATLEAQVVGLADVVIVPTIIDLGKATEDLYASAVSFRDSATLSNLKALQTNWKNARNIWIQGLAARIGPVSLDTLLSVDTRPINSAAIELYISGTNGTSAIEIEALGTDKKGFFALEYLLFDSSMNDNEWLARLSGDSNARRRQIIVSLAENLRNKIKILVDAWSTINGVDYRDFVSAGRGSSRYLTRKNAIDASIEQMIYAVEVLYDQYLGVILGKTTKVSDNKIHPEFEVASRSDNTLAEMSRLLTGIRNAYFCTYANRTDKSIHDLVRTIDSALDDRITTALNEADEAVKAIPFPIRTSLVNQTTYFENAYEKSKTLRNRFEMEVIKALSVQRTYQAGPSDND